MTRNHFATLHYVSDCLGRLATASERTSVHRKKGPSNFSDMGPYLIIPRKIPGSVIVLCAQGMDLSRHMVLAGGRLRPVKGGAAEGGFGRYKGEIVKPHFSPNRKIIPAQCYASYQTKA